MTQATTPVQGDGNDLLMNGSGGMKSCKFSDIGSVVRGTVAEPPKAVQSRVFNDEGKPTNELKFWPSGDPMMEVQVVLQTTDRDPDDEEDTGLRILHINPRMQSTVRDAVNAVKAPGLEVGGELAVQWVSGTGHGKGNPRSYAAAYRAPVAAPDAALALLSGSGLVGGAAPAPAAPVAQPPAQPAVQQSLLSSSVASSSPVPAAPAQQVPLGSVMDRAAPAGVDPAVWAGMPEAQRITVLAALGQPAF